MSKSELILGKKQQMPFVKRTSSCIRMVLIRSSLLVQYSASSSGISAQNKKQLGKCQKNTGPTEREAGEGRWRRDELLD